LNGMRQKSKENPELADPHAADASTQF